MYLFAVFKRFWDRLELEFLKRAFLDKLRHDLEIRRNFVFFLGEVLVFACINSPTNV
jgi:hypothetical protein